MRWIIIDKQNEFYSQKKITKREKIIRMRFDTGWSGKGKEGRKNKWSCELLHFFLFIVRRRRSFALKSYHSLSLISFLPQQILRVLDSIIMSFLWLHRIVSDITENKWMNANRWMDGWLGNESFLSHKLFNLIKFLFFIRPSDSLFIYFIPSISHSLSLFLQ